MQEVKISIISDLHCHVSSQGKQESYLLVDKKDIPINQNPVITLERLIAEEGLVSNFTIAPGDFANRVDRTGFQKSWKYVKQLAKKLGSTEIIATLGNHDVDSRMIHGKPFAVAKRIGNDFPLQDSNLNKQFWELGFAIRETESVNFLVINSAYDHLNKTNSEHGNISDYQLDLIQGKLEHVKVSGKEKFRLALAHHHPIQHDRFGSPTIDLLYNGRKLIELVEKYDYQLFIHGHKHDTLLSYSPNGTNSMAVFAAGSFSAYKDLLLPGAFNTFHLLTLRNEKIQNCLNQGEIKTWFFVPSVGWQKMDNYYFPHEAGFGCRIIIPELAEAIDSWFIRNSISEFKWVDLLNHFPQIRYLIPNDKKRLIEICEEQFNLSFFPKTVFDPQIVSKENTAL